MNSEMELDPVQWHWATELSGPQQGLESELVAKLATGELPPFALVWLPGWSEWLPAMQVASLSRAFPEHLVGEPREAQLAAPGSRMPRLPTSEFPRLRRQARESLRAQASRVTSVSELEQEEQLPSWATRDSNYPEQDSVTSRIPERVLREAAHVMTAANPPQDLGFGDSRNLPASSPPSARWAAEVSAAEVGSLSVSGNTSKTSGLLSAMSRHPVLLAAGAAALVGLGLYFATRVSAPPAAATVAANLADDGAQESDSAQPGDSEGAFSEVEAAPVLSPVCHPLGAPVKLDAWALADLPPLLTHIPGTSQVAIGYAKSREQARGLLLDVGTLKFERVFNEKRKADIYSVAPLAGVDKPSFRVERRSSKMAYSRALETIPPMRLGMLDGHVVLGRFDSRAKNLWPLPRRAIVSLPSVARLDNGFAIATRVGREGGNVRSGIVGWTGERLTDFVRLDLPKGELGKPVIVAGDKETVLAVTLRNKGQGDQLFLARAKNGQLPTVAKHLDIFESRVRLRYPVLAALPEGGGYVLGWTQGVGSRKRVRIVKLSADLKPVGPPADITSVDPELNGAVTGSMYWLPPARPTAGDGHHVLLFHFLGREKGHSLWVSDIACEPAQVGI